MNIKPYLALAFAAFLHLGASAQPTVDFVLTNGVIEPHSIAFAGQSRFYVTDSATHRVMEYNSDNGLLTTFAGIANQPGANNGPGFLAQFAAPRGIVAARGFLFVADSANHTIRRLTLTGSVSVVTNFAGSPGQPGLVDGPVGSARFNSPVGLGADSDGNLYVADSKNNAIRRIGLDNVVTTMARNLSEPSAVAVGDDGVLFIADTRSHSIKLLGMDGSLTLLAGSASRVAGTNDSYFAAEALFNQPGGLMWVGGSTGLIVSDTGNHTLRRIYYNPVVAAFFPELSGYSVETYSGTPRQPGFVDGDIGTARFNSPTGLARDTEGGLLVADLGNRAVRRIQTTPRLPRVGNPVVGYVIFVRDEQTGELYSRLIPFTDGTFNNEQIIAVLTEPRSETFFTRGPTPGLFQTDTIPAPTTSNGEPTQYYVDGLTPSQVRPTIVSPQPDVTIKVVSTAESRRPSDVIQARLQFKVATPTVVGDNPAAFTVGSETRDAEIWYTLDGSEPIKGSPSLPAPQSGSLTVVTNKAFAFRARAYRDNFKPSEIVTKSFSPTEFKANRITFGFERGEASSQFFASAGQRFYAPITLSLLPKARMMSLQFNLAVDSNDASPPVQPGAIGFQTMLEELIVPTPAIFRRIPPAMFNSEGAPSANPPPPNVISEWPGYGDMNLTSLVFTNSRANILGVGWLERAGSTNLYNTLKQDLITYSIAHDTLFLSSEGKVVVGAFAFDVPRSARIGDSYQIKIDRPSATSDGVGGPSGDVFIDLPTSGSRGAGAINSIKDVQVQELRYVVGDAAPFRWINAGDFGNDLLLNDDVMQVFQSAIYGLNQPLIGSDFLDTMDSCCGVGVVDPATGLYHPSQRLAGAAQNPLFDGNDQSIDTIAFGDDRLLPPHLRLDVADVYVTFRRSLDPTLKWFRRYWHDGQLVAERVDQPKSFRGLADLPAEQFSNADQLYPSHEAPSASFSVSDRSIRSGEVIEVPVEADVHGKYAARIALLNVEIQPLGNTPALETAVEFTPHEDLGQPTLRTSRSPSAFGGAWLDRNVAGLRGKTRVGTLRIQIPETLPPDAAYRVHFEHVSASPNGVAVFPQQVEDGLLLASSRTGSSYEDGIPDDWRLRYFGSTSNLLSHAEADADGDGVMNRDEFKAGTSPVDLRSHLRLSTGADPEAKPSRLVLKWPSVQGRKYTIESAASLMSREWTQIVPEAVGTGGEMEFTPAGSVDSIQFYRVRLVE